MKSRLFSVSKKDGGSPREMEIEEGQVFRSTKKLKDDEVKNVPRGVTVRIPRNII